MTIFGDTFLYFRHLRIQNVFLLLLNIRLKCIQPGIDQSSHAVLLIPLKMLLEQFILIVIFIYEATASVASMEATPL
jgi:hypothetical protein